MVLRQDRKRNKILLVWSPMMIMPDDPGVTVSVIRSMHQTLVEHGMVRQIGPQPSGYSCFDVGRIGLDTRDHSLPVTHAAMWELSVASQPCGWVLQGCCGTTPLCQPSLTIGTPNPCSPARLHLQHSASMNPGHVFPPVCYLVVTLGDFRYLQQLYNQLFFFPDGQGCSSQLMSTSTNLLPSKTSNPLRD